MRSFPRPHRFIRLAVITLTVGLATPVWAAAAPTLTWHPGPLPNAKPTDKTGSLTWNTTDPNFQNSDGKQVPFTDGAVLIFGSDDAGPVALGSGVLYAWAKRRHGVNYVPVDVQRPTDAKTGDITLKGGHYIFLGGAISIDGVLKIDAGSLLLGNKLTCKQVVIDKGTLKLLDKKGSLDTPQIVFESDNTIKGPSPLWSQDVVAKGKMLTYETHAEYNLYSIGARISGTAAVRIAGGVGHGAIGLTGDNQFTGGLIVDCDDTLQLATPHAAGQGPDGKPPVITLQRGQLDLVTGSDGIDLTNLTMPPKGARHLIISTDLTDKTTGNKQPMPDGAKVTVEAPKVSGHFTLVFAKNATIDFRPDDDEIIFQPTLALAPGRPEHVDMTLDCGTFNSSSQKGRSLTQRAKWLQAHGKEVPKKDIGSVTLTGTIIARGHGSSLGLIKTGPADLTLAAGNYFTGDVRVTQGTLRTDPKLQGAANAPLGDGDLLLVPEKDKTVTVVLGAPVLNIHSRVFLGDRPKMTQRQQAGAAGAKGCTLELNFKGSQTVAGFCIGGDAQRPGDYGAPGSGTQYTDPHLKGTGTLHVIGK